MYLPTQSRVVSIKGMALPEVAGEAILLPIKLRGNEALGELSEFTLELKTLSIPTLPVYAARE
ncbi:hypothetical protein, partial [Burkholderia paludis]